MSRLIAALFLVACLLLAALPTSAQTCGLTAGGSTFDFSTLSTYDICGTDGSAGSNEDNFYVARICGAVSDAACIAQSGSAGSMVCQHRFPYYNQVPNAGTVSPPSSALCSQNLSSLVPSYASSASTTTWALYNTTLGPTGGVQMTSTAAAGCPSTGGALTVKVNFFCAPLQTAVETFYAVSVNGCNVTMTLYTSLACTSAAVAPTAVAAPPAATASTCGFNGVSFASLAVDITATDEAGRTYIVHPCGAVSAASTTYCSHPHNVAQQPDQYPSACEVTGYCNPSDHATPLHSAAEGAHKAYATHRRIGTFRFPSLILLTCCALRMCCCIALLCSASTVWTRSAIISRPLPTGICSATATPTGLDTSTSAEGWTSSSSGCPGGSISTFTFICNQSATTTATTAAPRVRRPHTVPVHRPTADRARMHGRHHSLPARSNVGAAVWWAGLRPGQSDWV